MKPSTKMLSYKNLLIVLFIILLAVFVLAAEPDFNPISSFSLDEDFGTFTMNLSENITDDVDPQAGLTFNWTLNDSSVFSLDIINTTGIATFTSLTNSFGSVLVSISVVDTGGLSNSTEFTLTVNSACTYSGSGDWNFNNDNCVVTSPIIGDGVSNLNIINSQITLLNDVSRFRIIHVSNSTVTCLGGCWKLN